MKLSTIKEQDEDRAFALYLQNVKDVVERSGNLVVTSSGHEIHINPVGDPDDLDFNDDVRITEAWIRNGELPYPLRGTFPLVVSGTRLKSFKNFPPVLQFLGDAYISITSALQSFKGFPELRCSGLIAEVQYGTKDAMIRELAKAIQHGSFSNVQVNLLQLSPGTLDLFELKDSGVELNISTGAVRDLTYAQSTFLVKQAKLPWNKRDMIELQDLLLNLKEFE